MKKVNYLYKDGSGTTISIDYDPLIEDYQVKRSENNINPHKIKKEVMNFFVDFYLQMQDVRYKTLDRKFDWGEFKSFTNIVTQGAGPFAYIQDDNEDGKKWLIKKLSGIYQKKLDQKIAELNFTDQHLISFDIVKKFYKMEEIVRFYLSMFYSTCNPRYFDMKFQSEFEMMNDVQFSNLFYQMSE